MMTKRSIVDSLMIHFDIRELVCSHVYELHGVNSWLFLDQKLLETILILRVEIIKAPMIINNYHQNGNFSQRGLRCPFCAIPAHKYSCSTLYLSPHLFGMAIDFNVPEQSAFMIRQLITYHQKLLTYPIRLEDKVQWVHLDLFDNMQGLRICTF
jgi:hypothetical protein